MTSNGEKSATRATDDLDRIRVHITIIAILNIVVAVFCLLVTAMILYNINIADFASKNREFAMGISTMMAVMSLPFLFVGIGLLLHLRIARYAAILIGFIHLLEIPVGTPLGIYMLWLFLTQNTDSYFGKNEVPQLAIYTEDN